METPEQKAERFYRTAETVPPPPTPEQAVLARHLEAANKQDLAELQAVGLTEKESAPLLAIVRAQDKEIEGWAQETMATIPEPDRALALGVLDRFAPDDQEFRFQLIRSGLGSHPSAVRFLANIAAAFSRR
jgi:hypothetical protein